MLAQPKSQFRDREESAKRERKEEEDARHQVNTAVAMKIIPRASTLPTLPGAP